MTQGNVEAVIRDGIGVIEFFHPKANSLPLVLLEHIARQIELFATDEHVSVILLCSRGDRTFCAGASFEELVALESIGDAASYFMGFANIILAMKRSKKIVVTRVQGKAVGGAVGLIAASDYVVAASSAEVRLSELSLGIGPFVISEPIIRRIGVQHFSALSLDTEWRPAEWCEHVGLFSKVCDNIEELDHDTEALLACLSGGHLEAQELLKRVLWQNTDDWPALLKERAHYSAELLMKDWVKLRLKTLTKPVH